MSLVVSVPEVAAFGTSQKVWGEFIETGRETAKRQEMAKNCCKNAAPRVRQQAVKSGTMESIFTDFTQLKDEIF